MPDITFKFLGDPTPWTISGKSLELPLNDGKNGCKADFTAYDALENGMHWKYIFMFMLDFIIIPSVGWIIGMPFLKTVRSCEFDF